MAQRRMLSRSISTSQKVSEVSLLAKIIFTWSIPHTDDYGVMAGDADSVRWEVIPRIDVPLQEVEACLKELEKVGLIKREDVNGKKYLKIANFDTFQKFRSDRQRQSIINGYDNDIPTATKDGQGVRSIVEVSIGKDSVGKVSLSDERERRVLINAPRSLKKK